MLRRLCDARSVDKVCTHACNALARVLSSRHLQAHMFASCMCSGGCHQVGTLCASPCRRSSMLIGILLYLQVCMLVLPFVSLCNDKERHMEKLLKPLDRSDLLTLLASTLSGASSSHSMPSNCCSAALSFCCGALNA